MITDFSADHAIRWAVLMAYARNLPTALERVTVRNQAAGDHPGFGRQGRALVLARDAGLLLDGDVTPAGVRYAQRACAEPVPLLGPHHFWGVPRLQVTAGSV